MYFPNFFILTTFKALQSVTENNVQNNPKHSFKILFVSHKLTANAEGPRPPTRISLAATAPWRSSKVRSLLLKVVRCQIICLFTRDD